VFIEKLELIDYRNYKSAILEFDKPVVIIIGMNGQGKSNILEAICFLTTKTSFRARQLKEMIHWERDRSFIKGRVRNLNKVDEIEVVIEEAGATLLKNKIKEKAWRLQRDISTVVFTPDDLQIVKGSPQKRRHYIDSVIIKIKPTFLFTLVNYNRILQQRNCLLKRAGVRGEIEVWNEKLVDLGAKIIIEREAVSRIINEKGKGIYCDLLQEKERKDLMVRYLSAAGGGDRQAVKQRLEEELREREEEEREKGITLVGPHRDDLEITINNKEARLYASQGEERSVVLTLKLTEVELLREEGRQEPLILFDDVLSELDEQVRNKLMTKVNGRNQIFITATSCEFIPKRLTEAQWICVEGGRVGKWASRPGN
jgi:DNA replication and repair protein RecF